MTADGCLALSRAYAMESGAFVLHCTAAGGEKGIEVCGTEGGMFGIPGGGGRAVVGTDGRRVTEALGGEGKDGGFVEGIVFKDVELIDVVEPVEKRLHQAQFDKFGAAAKTDPREIALVKKLDLYMLVGIYKA